MTVFIHPKVYLVLFLSMLEKEKSGVESMRKIRRSWIVSLLFIIAFMGIIFRLYMIQIASTRSFSLFDEQVDLIAMAQSRQNKEVVIDSGRGEILDRNGKSLVGEKNWHLLVFPQSEEQIAYQQKKVRAITDLIHYPMKEFISLVTRLRTPMILTREDGRELILTPDQKEKIDALHLPAVRTVMSDQRMTLNQLGQQVIGQVVRSPLLMKKWFEPEVESGKWNSQSLLGISGLEAAFEPFLHGENEDLLVYTTTQTGRPLTGVQMLQKKIGGINEDPPKTIVTTIDKELQRQVEELMKEKRMEDGAVVVQQIADGDILAMASSPKGTTIEDEKNPWENRAVMEATPGSIFKTVVAVAALDTGLVKPDTVFYCNGKLDRYHLHDDNPKGHGRETFADAYANSCNVVLGTVAQTLGAQKLSSYAKRLGLAQEVIWNGRVFDEAHFSQLPEEQTGLIFAKNTQANDPGVLAQTGIGQHDVKMTPLQAVNMITSLFHRGKTLEPRLVKEICDQNGRVLYRFRNQFIPGAKPIKADALNAVKKMMRKVVTDGTGKSVSRAPWPLAGKTGTAQVGVKKDKYNKWMIGFGPADHPRYAVAVVLRSVPDDGDPRAMQIFQQVMELLAQMEKAEKKIDEKDDGQK
ncbi:penicillin-binding protein 2 [Thermoactinomyces daqus]|jgi:cell division protein FtsI/penicillin-binding protein 2|uniref:Penicillin-binding protein 2 n=1 Tax=Thermoactinomyces daqus TaxID=1329516 RepID=A0A7W2AIP8_9BACL|nr:penicillin-binding protein 2 [Thermoactinomyces daqus]MBA4543480.1 penicillin-binding protein 2 [Thermoactinomyces daqus]